MSVDNTPYFVLEIDDDIATLYDRAGKWMAWLVGGGATHNFRWALSSRNDGTDPHLRSNAYGTTAVECATAFVGMHGRVLVRDRDFPLTTEEMLVTDYLPARSEQSSGWDWQELQKAGGRAAEMAANGYSETAFVHAALPEGWRREMAVDDPKWSRVASMCGRQQRGTAMVLVDGENTVRAVVRCGPGSGGELAWVGAAVLWRLRQYPPI